MRLLLPFLIACAPPAGTVETVEFDSEVVGQTYSLTVFRPDEMRKPAHVVYLFDGDDWSDEVAQIVSDFDDPPLVVGIGYGKEPNERARDLTPEGLDPFYEFLETELVPFVDADYPTDARAAERTVLGHSFGGAAAVYGLLTAWQTFGNSVAISPSLTLDRGVLFDIEAERAANYDDLAARAHLSAGSLEAHGLAGLTQAMGETLADRDYPSLVVRTELFPRRVHADVFPIAADEGLRFVLEER